MNPEPITPEPIPSKVVTAAAARELTDRIKAHVEQAWELITQAYTTRAWIPLGYHSWDDYCTAEFDRARIRIPREERTVIVASLREIGMSTRAIAAVTRLGRSTVHREIGDRESGVPNGTPDSVVGLDGKTYQPKTADPEPIPDTFTDLDTRGGEAETPVRPRRVPITESFDAARRDLVKDTARLTRLVDDDRFARHATHLAHQHRSDLIRAVDALRAVLTRLPDPIDHPQEA